MVNINELINKHITIVIAIIIILIICSVLVTFILLKVTEEKYNNLEIQNTKLNEQVRTYTNHLTKLYEEQKFFDEEQDNDDNAIQHIPEPDVNNINDMPSMPVNEPVVNEPEPEPEVTDKKENVETKEESN